MEETTLPDAQQEDAAPPAETQQPEAKAAEGAEEKAADKPEKTPEELRRAEMESERRAKDRRTRQRDEARAEARQWKLQAEAMSRQLQELTGNKIERDNHGDSSNSELLTLSPDQLERLVESRLASRTAIEQRRGVLASVSSELGQQRFDEVSARLEDAFDGFTTPDGQVKPAMEVLFRTKLQPAILEYLSDPMNADEAEAFARMDAVDAAFAVADLKSKLAAKKAEGKPRASKAPAPIEPIRGGGSSSALPSDSDDITTWVKKERARMAGLKAGRA